MLKNKTCPYCLQKMVKAENRENSRSVEHLIPNAALTRKRKNDEGDFYVCRSCNSRKSSIDYVLGVISKAQSIDDAMAANTLINAISKPAVRAKRFIDMVRTAEAGSGCIHMEMPIRGNELIEYLHYLGKGQFFKATGRPYDPNDYVMVIQFFNKQVLASLEGAYANRHGSNSFDDLKRNHFSEVINDGECIIWSKDNRFLFIFHNYTSVIIEVLRKNTESIAKAAESEAYILEYFNYAT